jgi:uncharacterized protein HemX
MAEKLEAKKNTAPAAAAPAGKTVLGVKPSDKTAKPKGKVSAGAVIAVFLVVIIIAAAGLVYFNVGGFRQKLADALQTDQAQVEDETAAMDAAQIEQRQSELDAQAAQLDKQTATLKTKTDKIKEREKALVDNEKALADKETALVAREEAVATAEAGMLEAQQAQDNLAATAKIFEAMEPAVAATAISGLGTVDDMVEVLQMISSDKAADILGEMEVKLATKVLSEMMK